jgi:hypothetical protein
MLVETRIVFSFWVERALLRTLPERAKERVFHPGHQGRRQLFSRLKPSFRQNRPKHSLTQSSTIIDLSVT